MLVWGVVMLQVVLATELLQVVMPMTVVVKLVMIRCGRGGGDVADGDGDDVCGSYRSHCSSEVTVS